MTEDFEFRPVLAFFDLDSVYRGHDGFTRFWNIWRGAWETVTIEVGRIEDLGDQVLAMVVSGLDASRPRVDVRGWTRGAL
jgi:hypothetical protein